jgi:hypothetical protein
MSSRRDDERLADIVDAIVAIRSHLARGDLSTDSFSTPFGYV